VTEYRTNNINEYVFVGDKRFEYDTNGNLTFDGRYRYFYDYANRLCEVKDEAGVTIALYWFDTFGRRITTLVEGVVEDFYYDGMQVMERRNGLGEWSVQYIYGIGIDEPLLMHKSDGSIYWYHQNALGNVMVMTDSVGDVVEWYEYDVYGAVMIYDSSNEVVERSLVGNRYMFTGRRYDYETGLYFYRARYYHPILGRFLSRDPVFTPSVYEYCTSNPISYIDPHGTWYQGTHASFTEEVASKMGFNKSTTKLLSEASKFPDKEHPWLNFLHAMRDDTETREGALARVQSYITRMKRYATALCIAYIDSNRRNKDFCKDAVTILGIVLHTLQDVYAHNGMSLSEHFFWWFIPSPISYYTAIAIDSATLRPSAANKAKRKTREFLEEFIRSVERSRGWGGEPDTLCCIKSAFENNADINYPIPWKVRADTLLLYGYGIQPSTMRRPTDEEKNKLGIPKIRKPTSTEYWVYEHEGKLMLLKLRAVPVQATFGR